MEEPIFVSGPTTNRSGDISDSNGGPPSASKFKGVVVQPNGHWGAQIYANHQRIWLGTFKSEKEAATAYDSAAIKLRTGPTHRNFPWTDITVHEPDFQNQFSMETVLSMIKDGSYAAKFSDYLTRDRQAYNSFTAFRDHCAPGVKLRQLFQKELTPSDVSKLNRLVIPKKYALKYFPRIPDTKGLRDKNGGNVDDLELVFFDRSMRSWKLRYCYWKSSQSFVFTRGWNKFAKEKGLRPRDRVIFSTYESGEQKFCIIDVAYCEGGAVVERRISRGEALEMKMVGFLGSGEGMDLEPDLEQNANEREGVGFGETEENDLASKGVHPETKTKGIRLFGFEIV